MDQRALAMKITRKELDALPPKTKKHPHVMAMYLEHDYLDAYAMHTDDRVKTDGYKAAVGSADDWERHGDLQLNYLLSRGLQPSHRLLEIGCGTGRLARKVVPYLNYGCYTGVDISVGAINAARALARQEGWESKAPRWVCGNDSPLAHADFVWAFSVFIHLPADIMRDVMRMVAYQMSCTSVFYFAFVPERVEQRTGLKQFRHTLDTYRDACERAGLSFEECDDWTGEQHIAIARRVP
jgi:SAM-dependent methyltransferase